MMKPHQAPGANTLSCNHTQTWYMHLQADELCPQVPKMIGFPHHCFIKVGGVQADSKLQVAKLIFPLYKYKSVRPWGGFMYWLQTSSFKHLANLLLKSFFQVHKDRSARCLLGCHTLILLQVVWEHQKHPIPSKTSG